MGTHRVRIFFPLYHYLPIVLTYIGSGSLVLRNHSASKTSPQFLTEMVGNFVLWVMWLAGAVDTTVSMYINLIAYPAELFIYDRTELFPARIGAVQARNVES